MLEIVARSAQILLALAGAYVVALWFVLIVWTFRDVESRSRSVVTQIAATLLSVLFFVPGVLLYLILRPKETLDGTFQRSLEEEYLLQDLEELPLCQSCRRYVEDDFLLCPHCHAQLRDPCPTCARLVDLRWALCPYCAAVQHGNTAADVERVDAPAARWTSSSSSVRRRRRVVPTRPTVDAPAEPAAMPAPAVERPAIAAEASPISEQRPIAQPAPLTLMPSVGNLIRRTDRFRTRTGDGTKLTVAASDGATPADAAAADTPLDGGRSLLEQWLKPHANGNGSRDQTNGHGDDGDQGFSRFEPLTVVPAAPPTDADEAPADDLVLARSPRDPD